MTDPYAQAAAQIAEIGPRSSVSGSMSIHTQYETYTPSVADGASAFATSSQFKGGAWDPYVPNESLEGRLVVMAIKSYTDTAPVPESFNQPPGSVREEYKIDLIVLDGEPFSFDYKKEKASPGKDEVWAKFEVPEIPFVFKGQGVAQPVLVGKLNGARSTGSMGILGVMVRYPYAKDLKQGATIESVTAAVKSWEDRGKNGTKPKHTWYLDDRPEVLTKERWDIFNAWLPTYLASQVTTS